MTKYSRYLKPILKDMDKISKKLVKNNIQHISDAFGVLSIYLEKYIQIASYDIPDNIKVKFIAKIGYNNNSFSLDEARQIFNIINMKNNFMTGGATEVDALRDLVAASSAAGGPIPSPLSISTPASVGGPGPSPLSISSSASVGGPGPSTLSISSSASAVVPTISPPLASAPTLADKDNRVCLSDVPKKIVEYMQFFPPWPGTTWVINGIDKIFSNLFSGNFLDFDPMNEGLNCDWLQLFLFTTSILPVVGGFSNIVITLKAIIEERYFLAIITILTTITSWLSTFHIIDLGFIFKVFYYLDSDLYKKQYVLKGDTSWFSKNKRINTQFINKADTLSYWYYKSDPETESKTGPVSVEELRGLFESGELTDRDIVHQGVDGPGHRLRHVLDRADADRARATLKGQSYDMNRKVMTGIKNRFSEDHSKKVIEAKKAAKEKRQSEAAAAVVAKEERRSEAVAAKEERRSEAAAAKEERQRKAGWRAFGEDLRKKRKAVEAKEKRQRQLVSLKKVFNEAKWELEIKSLIRSVDELRGPVELNPLPDSSGSSDGAEAAEKDAAVRGNKLYTVRFTEPKLPITWGRLPSAGQTIHVTGWNEGQTNTTVIRNPCVDKCQVRDVVVRIGKELVIPPSESTGLSSILDKPQVIAASQKRPLDVTFANGNWEGMEKEITFRTEYIMKAAAGKGVTLLEEKKDFIKKCVMDHIIRTEKLNEEAWKLSLARIIKDELEVPAATVRGDGAALPSDKIQANLIRRIQNKYKDGGNEWDTWKAEFVTQKLNELDPKDHEVTYIKNTVDAFIAQLTTLNSTDTNPWKMWSIDDRYDAIVKIYDVNGISEEILAPEKKFIEGRIMWAQKCGLLVSKSGCDDQIKKTRRQHWKRSYEATTSQVSYGEEEEDAFGVVEDMETTDPLIAPRPPKERTQVPEPGTYEAEQREATDRHDATYDFTGRWPAKIEHAYNAQKEDELSLVEGDNILPLRPGPEAGWWFGKLDNGEEGLFPGNHVTPEPQVRRRPASKLSPLPSWADDYTSSQVMAAAAKVVQDRERTPLRALQTLFARAVVSAEKSGADSVAPPRTATGAAPLDEEHDVPLSPSTVTDSGERMGAASEASLLTDDSAAALFTDDLEESDASVTSSNVLPRGQKDEQFDFPRTRDAAIKDTLDLLNRMIAAKSEEG